jgi:RNA polymerase sigma-70 factor (ECF subfamily)
MANMARSRALDSLRRRKASRDDLKERVDEVHNLSDFRIGPEMSMLEDERSRIVRKAMLQLSPDHREAIELAYFSGLTHTEAAIQSGLPLGTVKTRIRSGMSHLRKLLSCFEEVL